jgi:hypothetical protein
VAVTPLAAVITTVCPAAAPAVGVSKPEVASTVAIAVLLLLQLTEEVMSLVDLSEYVPVATSCNLAFSVVDGFTGVTTIELNVMAGAVGVVGGDVVEGALVVPPPPPHADINNAKSAIMIERHILCFIDDFPRN